MSLKTLLLECAWFSALALGATPLAALGAAPLAALGAAPLAALAGAEAPGTATPGAVTAARLRPAVMARQPAQSVMLGAAMAGPRIVAVGERGVILLSDDQGGSWRQAPAPVSVTLTAVRFEDASHGVAVGHAGVVLVTADGGANWRQTLDGLRAAALALTAAKAGGDAAAIAEAERLVADGADKPLLDLCLPGKGRVLAVGAYGLAFASEDGGQSWTSWSGRMDNPKGLHLNAVRQRGDTILIGGERGLALLSTDGGRSFRRLALPYQGSFFTAELPASGELVLAGLRGNAWRSADGHDWSQLASPMPVSITASTVRGDGALLFANQAGLVLELRGQALTPLAAAPLPPLNGVLALNNGALLALTVQGLKPVAAPSAGTQP